MSSSEQRLNRILHHLLESINDNKFYEGHQALLAVVKRYTKSKKYSEAITLCYAGAKEFLKHNVWGSAIDLTNLMILIYKERLIPNTQEAKERIFDLVRELPYENKNIEKICSDSISWSTLVNKSPTGDPQLHHFFGTIFSLGGNYVSAEKNYLYGTNESATALGQMYWKWSQECELDDIGILLCRGVFSLLAMGNVDGANNCFKGFVSSAKHGGLTTFESKMAPGSSKLKCEYNTEYPLVNLCQLLVICVQKSDGDPNSSASIPFGTCKRMYLHYLNAYSSSFDPLFTEIGSLYFGIKVNRPTNLFAELFSNMFNSDSPAMIEN